MAKKSEKVKIEKYSSDNGNIIDDDNSLDKSNNKESDNKESNNNQAQQKPKQHRQRSFPVKFHNVIPLNLLFYYKPYS